MDLTPEDFTASFINSEVTKVILKSMNNGVVHLRALSRADIIRFREITHLIDTKAAINLFNSPETAKMIRDEELQSADDFLVFRAYCNRDGVRMFDDINKYRLWLEEVEDEAIEEILTHINKSLDYYIDEADEIEKKPKFSDEIQ